MPSLPMENLLLYIEAKVKVYVTIDFNVNRINTLQITVAAGKDKSTCDNVLVCSILSRGDGLFLQDGDLEQECTDTTY